jgi:hypothetical protein
MKLPSINLSDLAFIALVTKSVVTGGNFAEAAMVIALLGMRAYTTFMEKKTSFSKAEELEKRISSLETKLVATGLVKRSSVSNV